MSCGKSLCISLPEVHPEFPVGYSAGVSPRCRNCGGSGCISLYSMQPSRRYRLVLSPYPMDFLPSSVHRPAHRHCGVSIELPLVVFIPPNTTPLPLLQNVAVKSLYPMVPIPLDTCASALPGFLPGNSTAACQYGDQKNVRNFHILICAVLANLVYIRNH